MDLKIQTEQTKKTDDRMVAFSVYEMIGVGIYNPVGLAKMNFDEPDGSLRIWDVKPYDSETNRRDK
jgi:hypothetical protein